MITLKPITIPRSKIVSAEVFTKRITNGLDVSAAAIKREYKRTIRGWKRKPQFSHRISRSGNDWELRVYPDGSNAKQYIWVDLGTKPHSFGPRNAPALVFYSGFKPRTRRGWIGSGTQKYYPPLVVTQHVDNPGIKSRDFSETIAKNFQPTFVRLMESAVQVSVRQFEE